MVGGSLDPRPTRQTFLISRMSPLYTKVQVTRYLPPSTPYLGSVEVIHFIRVIWRHTGWMKIGTGAKPAGAMSDFVRGVVGVFAVGMIAGVGALMVIPQSSPSAMRFAEPPPRPCSQQTWPTNDRICQKWTAPRRSSAHGAADTPAPLANAQTAAQSEPAPDRSARRNCRRKVGCDRASN